MSKIVKAKSWIGNTLFFRIEKELVVSMERG
jgi:hypothetical protein